MKKFSNFGVLVSLFFLLISSFAGAAEREGDYQLDLRTKSDGSMEIDFRLKNYTLTQVNRNGTDYSRLHLEGTGNTVRKGFASLPIVRATLRLDPGKAYDVELLSESFSDMELVHPVIPSRGVIYRNMKPSEIPYVVDPESITDSFYPESAVDKGKPFIFRDERGLNVYLYPVRYNPVRGSVRISSGIRVAVREIAAVPVNPLEKRRIRSFGKADPARGIYRSLFLNYSEPERRELHEKAVAEFGDILVIHTPRDEEAANFYAHWKMEKGFNVKVVSVEKGANVKSLIASSYNENSSLLYVQLFGDWEDIKSDTDSFYGMDGYESAPTDPMLGCVAGNDLFPELAVGRFSANSLEEAKLQVEKSIAYEKEPDKDGKWYRRGVVISSSEGAGTGDDRESDEQHMSVIRESKLLKSTYESVSVVTESEANPAGSGQVVDYVNEGLGLINYVGHGDERGFVTTGFDIYRIADLDNGSMQPFIISVACWNGRFHKTKDDYGDYYGDCFAEKWLKKSNGGAIATLMSTILQPWAAPMRGQDYMNDILIGGYDYETGPGEGISTTEGRTTFGSMALNGVILMLAENEYDQESHETIKTWTIFGDAAVQMRTDTPADVSVSNREVTAGEPFVTIVQTDGKVENAIVSLSQNETSYTGRPDSEGRVTISHQLKEGAAKLVVSGFNLNTIYEEISVSRGSGNGAPKADAGSDIEVMSGDQVMLDGTASSDPDGDKLSYRWIQVSGIQAALSSSSEPISRFIAPESVGELVFELVVDDGMGNSSSDRCTVTVAKRKDEIEESDADVSEIDEEGFENTDVDNLENIDGDEGKDIRKSKSSGCSLLLF